MESTAMEFALAPEIYYYMNAGGGEIGLTLD
jgi:hypothetical protein